ncbi:Metalloprotease TldD [Buchnera aphidicola (Eriosoma lanigerum)]|uniref:metalloprotease TldD n=1 Tax=Buchnera aphidicola TaxID=9 RepID=UPI0034639F2F
MVLKLVTDQLLTINNIDYKDLLFLLTDLSNHKIDYGELYFQSQYYENWILEDGKIKNTHYHLDNGVGVRAIHNQSTGFSYSNTITLEMLKKNVQTVKNVINNNNNYKVKSTTVNQLHSLTNSNLYTINNPLLTVSNQEKIDLLYRINNLARKIDNRIVKVNASLTGMYEYILITSTDGILAADIRPLVHLSINVLAESNHNRERGNSGGGGRYDYNFFYQEHKNGETWLEYLTQEAVRLALINLSAVSAPAGMYPVVLGNGWPGILLHEAVGHGLEGDFNRRETSIFSNKIGNKVASNLCTVVDDGTMKNRRGSLTIDDEGTPSQYNILIKNGILQLYLQDKFNAKLMNLVSTGNARRESYSHLPIPRMTNTYLLAGDSTPTDIINSIDYGLYALNFSGGQVDITSGQFVFSTSEAYIIKNGKITFPVKGVTLIGSGIEVMNMISMVGNDLNMDTGVGICVKDGQSIPVGVGQPTIKVDQLTIGGTG